MPIGNRIHRRCLSTVRLFGVLAFLVGSGMMTDVHAGTVTVTGGSLSITYDGNAYANPNNVSPDWQGTANTTQPILVYGAQFSGPQTVGPGPTYADLASSPNFRPLPPTGGKDQYGVDYPNFLDNYSQLSTEFPVTSPTVNYQVNGNGPVAASAGENQLSTTMAYDPMNLEGTVSGAVETNGVTSWWVANDGIIEQGASWISWGDLALWYDPSRVAAGYSGWVFSEQEGGKGLLSDSLSALEFFDTNNISITQNGSGFTISGTLYASDGQEDFGFYTGIAAGTEVGSFSFTGTVVPEVSSIVMLGIGGFGGSMMVVCRRFRSKP